MCSLLHSIDRQSVSVFHKVFLCFRMPRQGLSNDIMKGFHLQPYQSVDVFFCFPPTKKDVLHFIIFIETVMESKKNNHWKPGTMENSDGQHHRKPRRPRDFQQIQHTQFSLGKLWGKHTKPTLLIICHLYDKENHSYMTYIMSLRLLKRWKWWRIQRTESSLWQMFIKIGIQHRIRILDTSNFILGEWTNNLNRLPLQKWQVWELAQQKNKIVPFTIGSL